ncbi:hypothetical protein [Rhizobium ruizarguesonis]|uniref:hypothetical protein n=1 Tax=Rhizobium ruizarguesonis TaxID=2081791 RepID=UPI0010303360|nr:hypothetical protein [Rhizobium ruizarguesonis]TBD47064.1 hypothetical protein ELH17_08150 [Rhizobium ruizarguesonis]
MIKVLTQVQAVYFARAGYRPWERQAERRTTVAEPDEGYRGGLASTADRGAQIRAVSRGNAR